jgi:hypothetical protein
MNDALCGVSRLVPSFLARSHPRAETAWLENTDGCGPLLRRDRLGRTRRAAHGLDTLFHRAYLVFFSLTVPLLCPNSCSGHVTPRPPAPCSEEWRRGISARKYAGALCDGHHVA